MADILLPEATDLESTQLIRLGRTKFVEQFWLHEGFVLRQPAVAPQGDTRDFTWIATELARRTELLETYNAAINRGACGVRLKSATAAIFRWTPARVNSVDEIWNAVCKAASHESTGGRGSARSRLVQGKRADDRAVPHSGWYLYPTLKRQGLRFELPYQERLTRSAVSSPLACTKPASTGGTGNCANTRPLPVWHDFPALWEEDLVRRGHRPEDFPFWLLTTKSMQYHSGGNAMIQLMDEVARNVRRASRHHHQRGRGRTAGDRRRRPARDQLAHRSDARSRHSGAGDPSRHAGHRRAV